MAHRVKRMRAAWVKLLLDPQTDGSEMEGLSVATPLVPRIKQAVSKLSAVTSVDLVVHLEHYNRIIPEAAVLVRTRRLCG